MGPTLPLPPPASSASPMAASSPKLKTAAMSPQNHQKQAQGENSVVLKVELSTLDGFEVVGQN